MSTTTNPLTLKSGSKFCGLDSYFLCTLISAKKIDEHTVMIEYLDSNHKLRSAHVFLKPTPITAAMIYDDQKRNKVLFSGFPILIKKSHHKIKSGVSIEEQLYGGKLYNAAIYIWATILSIVFMGIIIYPIIMWIYLALVKPLTELENARTNNIETYSTSECKKERCSLPNDL